jgi:hypothetical protein
MNDLEKTVKEITQLVRKSSSTITLQSIRETIRVWIRTYSTDLRTALSNSDPAIKALDYLIESSANIRLNRSAWLAALNIISRALHKVNTGRPAFVSIDPNQPYSVYLALQDMFAGATAEISIYDGYVEPHTLRILSRVNPAVSIRILTNHAVGDFVSDFKVYKKQFPNATAKQSGLIHDRFFSIDGKTYILGTSLHSVGGKKATFIMEVDASVSGILGSHYNALWNTARNL